MLKAIFLLLFSFSLSANSENATYSVQRWQNKIVVTINHDKGWHTYWKNPGDAGLASVFTFSRDTKAYEWPVPKKYLEAGDILTIGYGDVTHFFFENIKEAFSVKINVLICKDICIPGESNLKLNRSQSFSSSRPASAYTDRELLDAFNALPKEEETPPNFEYYLTREKNLPKLTLHYSLKNIQSPEFNQKLNLLTSFPHPPFGFLREQLYFKDGVLYGKTPIDWDGEYMDPPLLLPESGKFKESFNLKFLINLPGRERVSIITLKMDDFSLHSKTLDKFYENLSSLKGKVKLKTIQKDQGILRYLLFAFLGGLILNLMPCVLPVISLKLFGLIKQKGQSQRKILTHNLTYTAGVVSTFLILGAFIAGIKATGDEIGWGFQLQSPAFILLMMLILFILSLNLFGLFEFRTPGGAKLGSTRIKEGFAGDFLTGVLTTILSTPCSAPFLGTALTFAFTTSSANIFLMFSFIGLGLSFPFILTGIFPKTLNIFPRPGAWMEKLKSFLGLTLIITVIWLYDVFVSLVNFELVSWRLNLLFVLWFFAFYFLKNISKKRILQLIVFLLPSLLTVLAIKNLELRPTTIKEFKTSDSRWQNWSEKRLKDLKGKTVFMDFTAEWCLTCKVNKKLVLETQSFLDLASKKDLVLLRADWTKRDDEITQFLKRFEVVGVPAYFIQKPDGTIISLGETISTGKVEENLKN